MKYKMFVCDLDGTLLDNNHKISEENLKAIKALEAKGIKFVIATGRTKHMLEDYLEILDYKMPLIWSNGAAVSDVQGDNLYTKEIQIETTRKVIKLAHEHNMEYVIYTLEGIVGENKEGRIRGLSNYNNGVKEEYRIPLKVDRLLYSNLENYKIIKLSVSSRNSNKLHDFQDIINLNIDGIDAVFSDPRLLDITRKDASKGEAVLDLARQYNIDLKEIIAIGDNQNDISMLEICGLPLTLENAVDAVKEVAAYITKDNNSSGVAYAINNMIIGK